MDAGYDKNRPKTAASAETDVPQGIVRLLGCVFLVVAALLAYFLAAFWPVKTAGPGDWQQGVTLIGYSFTIATEVRLIWIVAIAAALGSYVHIVTSFATYVGNQRLHRSWLWWYILRAPIGVSLALVFYFVIRAGLFSSGALGTDISPFGVAALSGMVGMFSKQATDKLREVFDNLFRTSPGHGDDMRADKATVVKPVIEGVDPATVKQGAGGVSLKVRGQGFTEDCSVLIGGKPRATEFRGSSELTCPLGSDDTASEGTLEMSVRNPGPPEQRSNVVTVAVRSLD